MLGELILNITARVDGLLTGLSRARTAVDQTTRGVSQNFGTLTNKLDRQIKTLQTRVADAQRDLRHGWVTGDAADAMRRDIGDTQEQIGRLKNVYKDINGYQRAFNAQSRAAMDFARAQVTASLQGMINVGSMLRQVGATLRNIGIGLLAVSAGLVHAWRDMATTGAEFQQTMDIVVSVVTELQDVGEKATAQFVALNAEIMRLGQTTNFTASEVATAAQFLGQAGFTAQQTTEALEATVNLARAGMLDLARASEITADMVNAFTLQAKDAARVSDVFAKAQASANTTVQQLGNAFSFAAPVAAALGQRVEDTATALSVLANNSIKSSRAGTGLAQILSGLIRKTAETTELMEKYGSSFEAVDPTMRSIIDIIKEFKTVGVSAADTMEFFGERAGRAMLALMNTPTAEIAELGDAIEHSFGESLKQATIRWDNLNGSIREFVSRLEAIKIKAFEAVKDELRAIVDTASAALQTILDLMDDPKWGKFVKPILLASAAFSGLVAVLGVVVLGLGAVAMVVGGVTVLLASLALSAASTDMALEGAKFAAIEASEGLLAAAAAAEATRLEMAAGTGRIVEMTAAYAALDTAARRSAASTLAAAGGAAAGGGAAGGAAAGGGAARTMVGGTLGSQLISHAKKVQAAFGHVFRFIGRHIPIITTLIATVVGVIATWEPAINGVHKRFEAWGAVFRSLGAVVMRFVHGVTHGFNEITGSADAFLDDVFGGLTSQDYSLWEDFTFLLRKMAGWFVKLGVSVTAAVGGLGRVVGQQLGYVAAFIKIIAAGLVALAIEAEYWASILQTSLYDWALGLAGVENASEKLNDALSEVGNTVEDVTEKVNDYITATSDLANLERNATKEIDEMMSLMERRDTLNSQELKRLAELKRAYPDVEQAITNLIAATEEGITATEKQLESNNLNADSRRHLTILLRLQKEQLEHLMDDEQRYTELLVTNGRAVREHADATEADGDAQHARELILKQGTEAQEAYTESIEDWNKIITDAANSRLTSYELEVKKLNELRAETDKLAVALQEQLVAKIALKDQELQETNDRLIAARVANEDITKLLATQQRQLAERLKLTDKQAEIEQDRQVAQRIFNVQEKEAKQKIADKQTDILNKQKIQQAKQAGDKILAARLTAEAEFEADKKRIEETFLLDDKASQLQKAEALRNAEEIKDAKIAAAQEAADEEAKKAEEAAEKEKQKKLKALDKTRESLEDKIAASLAKRVTSLREMVALTFTLMRLEAIKEARAREAAKRAASEAARVERLTKIAAADPTNERKQAALLRAQQSARIEALMAGKKLTDAGLTAEAGQAVEQLFAPKDVTQAQNIGTSKILEESKLIQQNILDVLLSMQFNAPLLGLATGGPSGFSPLGAGGVALAGSTNETNAQVDVTINNEFDAEVAEAAVYNALNSAGLAMI